MNRGLARPPYSRRACTGAGRCLAERDTLQALLRHVASFGDAPAVIAFSGERSDTLSFAALTAQRRRWPTRWRGAASGAATRSRSSRPTAPPGSSPIGRSSPRARWPCRSTRSWAMTMPRACWPWPDAASRSLPLAARRGCRRAAPRSRSTRRCRRSLAAAAPCPRPRPMTSPAPLHLRHDRDAQGRAADARQYSLQCPRDHRGAAGRPARPCAPAAAAASRLSPHRRPQHRVRERGRDHSAGGRERTGADRRAGARPRRACSWACRGSTTPSSRASRRRWRRAAGWWRGSFRASSSSRSRCARCSAWRRGGSSFARCAAASHPSCACWYRAAPHSTARSRMRCTGLGFAVMTGYGLTETSAIVAFNRPGAVRAGTAGRALRGRQAAHRAAPTQPAPARSRRRARACSRAISTMPRQPARLHRRWLVPHRRSRTHR